MHERYLELLDELEPDEFEAIKAEIIGESREESENKPPVFDTVKSDH